MVRTLCLQCRGCEFDPWLGNQDPTYYLVWPKNGGKNNIKITYNKTCCVCMHAKSFQACLILCNPMDCSPPGSSVHGIFQSRILGWVAMPSSRGSSQPRDRTCISYGFCIAGGFFTTEPPGKPAKHVIN